MICVNAPKLSVVIVSYHSQHDLARCLPSLYCQTYPDSALEIIVVDNSPGDGTALWLQDTYPNVVVVTNSVNNGYAGGNNLGLAAVKGQFVLILNPDTELDIRALDTLMQAVCQHPHALITAKLLQPNGTINACGLEMHYTGITTCRGLNKPGEMYSGLHPVPLLSGACLIAATQVLVELGGFDESYFMYLEDVELSLRARLLGHDLLCAGNALVTHHYKLAMSATKFYYLERNRLFTLLTIYSRRTLWHITPALLLTECFTWAFAFIKGPSYLIAHFRSYHWLWHQRVRWWQKHKHLQSLREMHDEQLLAQTLRELPFKQLIANKWLADFLSQLTKALYRTPLSARTDLTLKEGPSSS